MKARYFIIMIVFLGSIFTNSSYAGRTGKERDDDFQQDPSGAVKKRKHGPVLRSQRQAPTVTVALAAPLSAAEASFANVGEYYPEALEDAHLAQYEGNLNLYRALLLRAAKGQDVAAMFELLLNIKDQVDGETCFGPSLRKLFEDSATTDNALALNNLGYVYKQGLGGPVGLADAFKAYLGSVRLGNPVGFFNLALIIMNGDYLPPNPSRAEDLLQRAAAHGLEAAQLALAHYYLHGAFGNIDIDKAQVYFEQAAANGSEEAKAQLCRLVDIRNEEFRIGADDMLIPVFDIDDEYIRSSFGLESP